MAVKRVQVASASASVPWVYLIEYHERLYNLSARLIGLSEHRIERQNNNATQTSCHRHIHHALRLIAQIKAV